MLGRRFFVVTVVLASVSGPARALEYGLGVGYGARYSDNIRRVAQNPVSDIEHNLVGNGRILVQTQRLDLSAAGSMELKYYSDDSFDPRSIATLNGTGVYTFVPDRLTWTASDTLADTRVNSLLPATSDNLEQTNRFSTGPDITLRPSSRNTIGMLARYENDRYQVSDDLSNNRGVGEINWKFRLSEPLTALLRYRHETVRYRNDRPGVNFVKDVLTAGFEGNLGAAVRYRIEAGPSRIQRDLSAEVTTTAGIAQLTRQINRDSGFSITLTSDLSDSGRSALSDPALNPVLQVPGVNPGQVDIVDTRAGNADFFSTLGFLKYRLSATVRDENFQTSNRDVRATGGGLTLEYEFGPRLVGLASGRFTRSDYPLLLPSRVDDDTLANVGLQFRFRRHWSAGLFVSHDNRDSTDSTQSYEENSIGVTVAYRYDSQRIPVGE